MSTSKLQNLVGQNLGVHFGKYTIRENTRPTWMTATTGERLELDFYIEELEIAVEVQGNQHYQYVPLFHQSYEGFEERIRLDKEKADICNEFRIDLLYLSSESEMDDLISKIYSKVKDEEDFGIEISPIKGRNIVGKQIKMLISQYVQTRIDNGGVENDVAEEIRKSLQRIGKFKLTNKQKEYLLRTKRASIRKRKNEDRKLHKVKTEQICTHPLKQCPVCGEIKSEANFDTLDVSRSHMCRSCRRKDRVENGFPKNHISLDKMINQEDSGDLLSMEE